MFHETPYWASPLMSSSLPSNIGILRRGQHQLRFDYRSRSRYPFQGHLTLVEHPECRTEFIREIVFIKLSQSVLLSSYRNKVFYSAIDGKGIRELFPRESTNANNSAKPIFYPRVFRGIFPSGAIVIGDDFQETHLSAFKKECLFVMH